jgi:hypothetical protein
VKILVRHSGTGLYLGRDGGWADKIDAQEFETIQEAGEEAWHHEDAQVVLSYDKPKCELVLDPAYCVSNTPPEHPSFPPPRPARLNNRSGGRPLH